jgi:DNA-3-methyladenine glycosylase I
MGGMATDGTKPVGMSPVSDEASDDGTDGRCRWALSSPEMLAYHDQEWGVPVRDERTLFEFLTLEGAQAGLSWSLILSKREGYRKAFAGFAPELVARFEKSDVDRLVRDPAIVRNRQKIESTVANARVIEAMHSAGDTLAELLWSFVSDATVHTVWADLGELPSWTPTSKAMSAELRRRGFRFVGPVTCYSTMQAVGLVNDHLVSCPRWQELGGAVGSTR